MTFNYDEFKKKLESDRVARKKLEGEIDQSFLETRALFAKLHADMYPAASAARMDDMRKDHAAQLDEMDRILAEEEEKLKAQNNEWAKDEAGGGK